jgi:MFS family permease
MLSFGPRSGMGFFLTPMSSAHNWGRDLFALAIQMLLWGAAQPFAGAMADRFGAAPVLSVGGVLYALGLAAMAYAATPAMLNLSARVIIGFGLAGSSFTVVIGAFGKLMPLRWRSLAFGAVTAAGSFGQFLFSPLAVALIDGYGWHHTLWSRLIPVASPPGYFPRACVYILARKQNEKEVVGSLNVDSPASSPRAIPASLRSEPDHGAAGGGRADQA